MSSRWGGSWLLFFVVGFGGTGCVAPEPAELASGSLIQGRAYGQIVDELKDLASRFPETAKYIKYGESVGKRELAMLRIGRDDLEPDGKRPAVIISGSIHGNEFLNIEDRLPAWFLAEKDQGGVKAFLDAGGFIYIAPILNPDGYMAGRRSNDRGYDLNRDFALERAQKSGFTQPETADLVSFLQNEQSAHQLAYKLTFDMHCCVGGVIYPWGHAPKEKLAQPALDEHQRVGRNIILAHFPGYRLGQAQDVVGYTAAGASDDFFFENFASLSFTFEGLQGREKDQFAQHTKMWDALLADQAGAPLAPTPAPAEALRLAVIANEATGIVLGAPADRAAPLALCRGTPVACLAKAPPIVGHIAGERGLGSALFMTEKIPLSKMTPGDPYTLLTLGAGGQAIGAQGVIFAAR